MRKACGWAISTALVLGGLPTLAAGPVDQSQECLSCHGDPEMAKTFLKFENRTSVALFVEPAAYGRSVHGFLDCTDCHAGFDREHPTRRFQSRMHYQQSLSQACLNCHQFGGIHARMTASLRRLSCVTCHGAHGVQPAGDDPENCLGCHGRDLEKVVGEGQIWSLAFDREQFAASVHASLRCVDCHFGFSTESHPDRSFQNRRELTLAHAGACRRCHFDKYTMTMESVHAEALKDRVDLAPVCSDCHGSHSVKSGHSDKLAAARRCRTCHEAVYDVYSGSIHGKALLSEANQDVPICSDCHSAHRIQGPRKSDFRNDIPQMCGDCHADEAVMKKYGLSTSVLASYLQDFHGVTLTFYRKEKSTVRHIAVCTDCHGVHDVASLKGRDAGVVKTTLLRRCRRCHEEATENFPDAWISHYEPSFSRAPLVNAVSLFYRIFIPFMVVGLGLQILLHIWRYSFNR